MSSPASKQELQTKQLKRSLDGWREIILTVHSVLLWEKHWHPGALFGVLSSVFMLFWLLDPTVLTSVATIGLLVTVGDYLVPTLAAGIFRNDMWTGAKEKKYDEICRSLVYQYTQLSTVCSSYYLMRTVRPKMYYAATTGSLLVLAWIGSAMNNLFLTYLLLLVVVMLPGMEHQGLITKYGGCALVKIREMINKSAKLKPDTKVE